MNHMRRANRKGRFALLAVLAVSIVFCLVMVRHSLLLFATPEAAYRDAFLSDAELIVEGPDSVLAVGTKNGEILRCIIDQEGSKWRLRDAVDSTPDITIPNPDVWLYLIRCDETNSDYFLVLESLGAGIPLEVSDSKSSNFAYLGLSTQTEGMVKDNYYAYLNDLDDLYVLVINGQEYPIVSLWNQIMEGTE